MAREDLFEEVTSQKKPELNEGLNHAGRWEKESRGLRQDGALHGQGAQGVLAVKVRGSGRK